MGQNGNAYKFMEFDNRIKYKDVFFGLFSAVEAILDSIEKFRFIGDEVSKIYTILKTAANESEDIVIAYQLSRNKTYHDAVAVLFNAVDTAMFYAYENRKLENAEALCHCLRHIKREVAGGGLRPPENSWDFNIRLGKLFRLRLEPHMRDIDGLTAAQNSQ